MYCTMGISFSPFLSVIYFLQVCFAGEKIGDGIGRTRREAHIRAAEASLLSLAGKMFYYYDRFLS